MSRGTSAERARHSERRAARAAVISAAALLLITVIAFAGIDPFAHPYEIRGVFASANQLRPGNDVRVAGVTVGHVSAITAGRANNSIVTMRIDDGGRPVHADAQLAILPRLLLEGSDFVALRPGTPDAPALPSGGTIPQSQTSVPVQLDQVLDVFDTPTRGALWRSISELARGLGSAPPGLEKEPTPPGYRSLRVATLELARALPPAAAVARAMRGTAPGDLGRAVRHTRDLTTQLAADPQALADGVTNFNRLTGVLANEDGAVTASIRSLDRLTRSAPAGLRALDDALPAVTDFAAALDPTLRAAPSPLRSASALVAQLQALFGQRELPPLLQRLAPTLATLPTLERRLTRFSPLVSSVNQCTTTHVVWTLDQKLSDGPNTTDDPVWLDVAHAETGAAGVVSGFDGNGVATHVGATTNDIQIDGVIPGFGHVIGRSPKLEGVRPTWLGYGVEPPYRPDQWCSAQRLPDLGARSGGPPQLPTNGRTVSVGGILP